MISGGAYGDIIGCMQIIRGVSISKRLYDNFITGGYHEFVAITIVVARDDLEMIDI